MPKCPKCGATLEHIGDGGISINKEQWHVILFLECEKCKKSWNFECSPVSYKELVNEQF